MRSKISTYTAIIASLSFLCSDAAWAATPQKARASQPTERGLHELRATNTLSLNVGDMRLYKTHGLLRRAAIDNPDIAMPVVLHEDQVALIGLKPGESTLGIWDDDGVVAARIMVRPDDSNKSVCPMLDRTNPIRILCTVGRWSQAKGLHALVSPVRAENPAVADGAVLPDGTLCLIGLKSGSTGVSVKDHQGLPYQAIITVSPDQRPAAIVPNKMVLTPQKRTEVYEKLGAYFNGLEAKASGKARQDLHQAASDLKAASQKLRRL